MKEGTLQSSRSRRRSRSPGVAYDFPCIRRFFPCGLTPELGPYDPVRNSGDWPRCLGLGLMAAWILWISNTRHRMQALPTAHCSLVRLNTHCQRPVETTPRQSWISRLHRIGVCHPWPVLLARRSFIAGHHEAASRKRALTIRSSRRRLAAS